MDESLKKLKNLVKFMKKEGVLSLKAEGIELSLTPGALLDRPEGSGEAAAPIPSSDPFTKFTPEQIALWSSPGFGIDQALSPETTDPEQ